MTHDSSGEHPPGMRFAESRLALGDGREIFIWYNRPHGDEALRGTILLAPGFCRRMYNLSSMALYLVANGFEVYRYDPLNHLGPSTGELADFTMSSGQESMERVLDWLATEHGITSLGMVATSLSARIAYRLVGLRPALRYLVTAVGVTHLQDTLHRVFGVDHMAQPVHELPPTVSFEDKYEITTYPFATDAHEHGWNHAATTRAELDRVHVPIAAFIARNDDWVLEREVEEALDLAHRPERQLYKLEGTGHNLGQNPRVAQAMLCEMTRSVMALAGGHEELPVLPREPSFEEITEHLIYERRRS